jgi:anti-anti-sigma factor
MNREASRPAVDPDDDWAALSSPHDMRTSVAKWAYQLLAAPLVWVGQQRRVPGVPPRERTYADAPDFYDAGTAGSATFNLHVSSFGPTTTIALDGELSAQVCHRLADALEHALEHGSRRLVLDLRNLETIDLAGVHVMLLAHLRASDQQTEFLLVPSSLGVQRVIDKLNGPFIYINS